MVQIKKNYQANNQSSKQNLSQKKNKQIYASKLNQLKNVWILTFVNCNRALSIPHKQIRVILRLLSMMRVRINHIGHTQRTIFPIPVGKFNIEKQECCHYLKMALLNRLTWMPESMIALDYLERMLVAKLSTS